MSPEVVNKLKIIEDCGANPQMKLQPPMGRFFWTNPRDGAELAIPGSY
jgi:hypothetical protein